MDGGAEAEGSSGLLGSGGLLGTPAALTSWKLPSLVLGRGGQVFLLPQPLTVLPGPDSI